MLDVKALLRALAKRRRDLRDLSAMSDGDLRDMGVSRAQAMGLAALPDTVPERMTAMARIFGLSPDQLQENRAEWHELLETCAHCGALSSCARFMEYEFRTVEAAQDFCPNAPDFTARA
ncbi:MAG: DUF1127 domain-containing protein [Paracoccaceae bacterium]